MFDAPNTTSRKPEEDRFMLGNFELMRDDNGAPLMLGKGTFGRTYKARHRFLDTVVALKVINERYASDPMIRQRFLAEGKAIARLSHPHIARLHDFGESDGALYYAMEFCSGGSLADYTLKHGAFAIPQLIDLAMQVCGALECAHGSGFVHRDIKPSNIMVTAPNPPLCTKLIDFGLVHATAPDAIVRPAEEDSEGRFLGTPLFASPEQLREQPVDGRSDLFSLGVTLWYLAAGGPHESGSSAVIFASRLSSESYATKLPRSLPEPLRLLLARLLEKDPSRRISSVGEALAAFNQCAASLGLEMAAEFAQSVPAESRGAQIATVSGDVQDSRPAELEVQSGPIDSQFKLLARLTDANTGTYYSAEPLVNPGTAVLLHALRPELAGNDSLLDKVCVNIGRIRSLALDTVIHPDAINRYSGCTAVLMSQPAGNLITTLRAQGIVAFSSSRLFLESVANASDQMQNANLPGVDLRPASIFLEFQPSTPSSPPNILDAAPRLLPKLLTFQDSAVLSGIGDAADASSTMTADGFVDPARESDPCWQFAALIYRIASGRTCHAAASLSPKAFVAVPGLSEKANRILSLIIAGEASHDSCGELLRELVGVEGVSGTVVGSKIGATSVGSRLLGADPSELARKSDSVDSLKAGVTATQPGSRIQSTRPALRRLDTRTATRSVAATTSRPAPVPPVISAQVKSAVTTPRRSFPLWIAVAVAVLSVGLGSAIFLKSRFRKEIGQKLPDNLVIRLPDDPAIQPAFKVANIPVPATQNGDEWILPLHDIPGKLPLVVKMEAFGYDPNEFTVHTADELAKAVQFSMNRSRGKIAFVGIPSEYSQASCLMKETLAGDKGHVDIPKYPTGYELHGDATAPLDLPTGIYLVNLKGKSAIQRWPVIATLKRLTTFSLTLPPPVEGHYVGSMSSRSASSSPDSLEINATVQDHSGAWIQRGSERQTLVEGRLNPAEGFFVARALASTTGETYLPEATIKIRRAELDSYDVFAANADGSDVQNFVLLGTVKRVGELSPTNTSQQKPQR